MRKLLNYYFKSRWHIISIISLILLLIIFVYLFDASYFIEYEYYDQYDRLVQEIEPVNSPFGILTLFAAIIPTIVVMFEFYFKMRKVSVDQIYALPIKREKIFLAKYFVCLAESIIPLTLSFILSFIMVATKPNIFNLVYFIPLYFGLVFLVIILTSSFAFIYTRTNAFFDGIINMMAYTLVLVFVVMLITDVFTVSYSQFGGTESFFIYSPISFYGDAMDRLLKGYEVTVKVSDILSLVLFSLFGGLSMWLFIKLNKEEPSENCTQLSTSWFAYRTMIPIFSTVFYSYSIFQESFLSLVFTLIFTYLGYVIYRRSFKLTKRDYLTIVFFLIIGIVLGFVFSAIFDAFYKYY